MFSYGLLTRRSVSSVQRTGRSFCGRCARSGMVRMLWGAITIAGLPACTLMDQSREAAAFFGKAQVATRDSHDGFNRAALDPAARQAAQHVSRPWLTGPAQPLSREIALPAALRANVRTALLFGDGSLDLPAIARRITIATGIPVLVRPDALLAPEAFLPRLAPADLQRASVLAPMHMELDREPEPLAQILDHLAARLSVLWRYEHGRIEFYRSETRVFQVPGLALNASMEASLGMSGAGESEGFVGNSRTRLESNSQDAAETLRARIDPFLSRAGHMVVTPGASASVVVTDTPEVLDRIGRYLEQESRALTRRVRLIFEEIVVQAHENAEAGINWDLVFNSARVGAAFGVASGIGGGGPGLVTRAGQGGFKASEAVVRALGETGQIVRHSRVPVMTLNRRPVTHAVRSTFSYIDKVETLALASPAAMAMPNVSVGQREQTVGSLLTLIPDAQDNGLILLSVAYDNTVAQPLRSITFGDKHNPLQLQQITIDGNGIVQQLAVWPGQPVLISGFDHSRQETGARRLNPGLPLALGGNQSVSRQQLTTVILVTAEVEE